MDWRERDYYWIGRDFLQNDNREKLKSIKSIKLHFSKKNHYPMRTYPVAREEYYNYPYPFLCCVSVRKEYSNELRKLLVSIEMDDSNCVWTDEIVISRQLKDVMTLSALPGKTVITMYGSKCHFKINDYVFDEYGNRYLVHSFPFVHYTMEAMNKGLHKNTEIVVEGEFKGRFLQERIPLTRKTRCLATYMGF